MVLKCKWLLLVLWSAWRPLSLEPQWILICLIGHSFCSLWPDHLFVNNLKKVLSLTPLLWCLVIAISSVRSMFILGGVLQNMSNSLMEGMERGRNNSYIKQNMKTVIRGTKIIIRINKNEES